MPTKAVVSKALSVLFHTRRRSPRLRWPSHNLHGFHLAFKVVFKSKTFNSYSSSSPPAVTRAVLCLDLPSTLGAGKVDRAPILSHRSARRQLQRTGSPFFLDTIQTSYSWHPGSKRQVLPVLRAVIRLLGWFPQFLVFFGILSTFYNLCSYLLQSTSQSKETVIGHLSKIAKIKWNNNKGESMWYIIGAYQIPLWRESALPAGHPQIPTLTKMLSW